MNFPKKYKPAKNIDTTIRLDVDKLLDLNTTEKDICNQLWAFLREGGKGQDLITLFMQVGITHDHSSHILNLLSEKVFT